MRTGKKRAKYGKKCREQIKHMLGGEKCQKIKKNLYQKSQIIEGMV